jgi:hypothetical protein
LVATWNGTSWQANGGGALTGDLAVGSAFLLDTTAPALTVGDSAPVSGKFASTHRQADPLDLVFLKGAGHTTTHALTEASVDEVFAQSSHAYSEAAF